MSAPNIRFHSLARLGYPGWQATKPCAITTSGSRGHHFRFVRHGRDGLETIITTRGGDRLYDNTVAHIERVEARLRKHRRRASR